MCLVLLYIFLSYTCTYVNLYIVCNKLDRRTMTYVRCVTTRHANDCVDPLKRLSYFHDAVTLYIIYIYIDLVNLSRCNLAAGLVMLVCYHYNHELCYIIDAHTYSHEISGNKSYIFKLSQAGIFKT